jgi:hypothetical protein
MADDKAKPRETVLPKLRPISHERAREIADEYTKHMLEKVEQARKKQKGNHDAQAERPNPTDED